MIIDQLAFIVFVVVCWVYLSAPSMIVLADKIFTFGLVYLILINLNAYHELDLAFKFLFGTKDLLVYSILVYLIGHRILTFSYLTSSLLNLTILVSYYLIPESFSKLYYDSFVYLVQFISAAQIIGITTNGRYSNDTGRKFFLPSFNIRTHLSSSHI